MSMTQTRRGLSLIELLVGMAMTAIVLGGAVAAIGLSGRTFRTATTGIRSSAALDALTQFSSDASLALEFTRCVDHGTEFWVPDRTGDGAPEFIQYTWSGTPGDPLTFSMNGSTPIAIIPEVSDLDLGYIVATTRGQATFVGSVPPVPPDQQIFERAYTGTGTMHTLGTNSAVAAIIQPSLTDGNDIFRVTRVRIPLRNSLLGGDATVSLHRVNMATGKPESTALSSTTVRQSDLPGSIAPVEFELNDATEFANGDYIAIVVSQASGLSAGKVALEASPQYLTDGWITTGTTSSWSLNATKDMSLVVFAEVFDRY